MARVFQYVRPVNAVLTSIELENKICPSQDGVTIKAELPDFDDPNPLITAVDPVTQNVNIENNECNLIREPVATSLNDSNTSTKKRKRNLNDDLDLQCVEGKRRRRAPSREIKDVPSKDSIEEIEREVLCDVCFVSFFSKKKLFYHTMRYRSLLVCEYCSSPFNLRATLYKHKLAHCGKYSPAPRAKLKCQFCERRFDNIERVQMHLFHCHANVMQPYLSDTNNSKTRTRMKNVAMRVANDLAIRIENPYLKILPATVITNVEEGTCGVNATMRAIDSAEENTRWKKTTECVIDNAEESTSSGATTITVVNNAGENTRRQDTTMHLTNNAEENVRRKEITRDVIDSAEENTCRKDTTVRVINNVEETSRSICSQDTTMRTMVNVEEPAEDIYMDETIVILDHVDKMKQNTHMGGTEMPAVDNTEGDMCMEETVIISNSDSEVARNMSSDDTLILAESDVKRLVENTPTEEIMNIIGVSKNVEEVIPTDNSRNCVPNNADKIVGNISSGDNTIRGTDNVNRMEIVDTVKQHSRRRYVKKANKNKQHTSIDDSTINVSENDGTMTVNVQTNVTVASKSNNVGKENPPRKRRRCRKRNVIKVEKNSSKRSPTKVNTEIKDVQNSSITMDTYLLNANIKIEPAEPEEGSDDCLIIDVENINEVTSTKNNITCSTENIDKSRGNVGRIQNTVEKVQPSVPTVDTEMLVSSTVPTFSFSAASPSTMPSSTVVTSTTPKKMRQTTLTEFLSFSVKNLNQTAVKTEKVDETEPSSSVSKRNAKKWKPVCTSTPLSESIAGDTVDKTTTSNASTPLLRMHMDPESIINLLTAQVKSEALSDYDSNVSQNSPYNLRKTKSDSCRSSPYLHGTISPDVMSAKRRKRTRKPKISLQEKLKAKYKCKDCVVRLERCDYTSKRVVLKTDVTKSTIPLQLTIGGKADRDSLSGKQTKISIPKIQIVTLENCFFFGVVESR